MDALQIINAFSNLEAKIDRFVRSHLSKAPVELEKVFMAGNASPGLGKLFVRSRMATELHEAFFTTIKYHEWNSRTLVKADIPLNLEEGSPLCEAISHIWRKLSTWCHHPEENSLETTWKDLKDVCTQAYRLALLLKFSKVAYYWEQQHLENELLTNNDIKIIGTTGPDPTDPYGDTRLGLVVFGAVYRARGGSFKIRDVKTRICLRKSEVTIQGFEEQIPGSYPLMSIERAFSNDDIIWKKTLQEDEDRWVLANAKNFNAPQEIAKNLNTDNSHQRDETDYDPETTREADEQPINHGHGSYESYESHTSHLSLDSYNLIPLSCLIILSLLTVLVGILLFYLQVVFKINSKSSTPRYTAGSGGDEWMY